MGKRKASWIMHIKVLLVCIATVTTTKLDSNEFRLTILHTNNVEGHVEEFTANRTRCLDGMACYGGVARRYHMVNQIRNENENVVLLDSGNQLYKNSKWFEFFKGNETAVFMNMLGYDAMALGYEEHERGSETVKKFIEKVNFTMLSCNLENKLPPRWPDVEKLIKKSFIIERNGRKIGIIGYFTEYMGINDVIKSIENEVKLLEENDVNIIILLASDMPANYKEVAKKVAGIDIVVGSSRLFQFKENTTNAEGINFYDPYPGIMNHSDGTKTLFVEAYEMGKYLGFLQVTFDNAGKLTEINDGNPILLDEKVIQDEHVLAKVKEMRSEIIEATYKEEIGKPVVSLESSDCCMRECNIGNMITDAMVTAEQSFTHKDMWTNVTLGLWSCGRINSSLNHSNNEWVTFGDIKNILPHEETFDKALVTGKILKEAFEHSVSAIEDKNNNRFLQVSGFRVKYNLKNKVGERLVELKALCTKCRVPMYEVVNDEEKYRVVLGTNLALYQDGFDMFGKVTLTEKVSTVESSVVDFVRTSRPLIVPLEERIVFIDKPTDCHTSSTSKPAASFSILYLSIVMIVGNTLYLCE